MYAVIRTGGKQYRVKKGDLLKVEKLEGDPGATLQFSDVLAVGEGEGLSVGTPVIVNALVEARITRQDRAKKIIVFKKKRRKKYRRKYGHRQPFTEVEILDISESGKKTVAAAKPAPQKTPAAEKPAAKKPAASKPAASKPAAKKPVAKKTTAKKTTATKTTARKTTAEKTTAKKTTAKKTTATKKTAKKPAAKK